MDSSKQTMNEEKETEDLELDKGTVEEETSQEEPVDLHNHEEGEVNEPSKSLDELEAKISELKDQLLRTVADSENLRKRLEREKEQTRKFGIANFAKDLLSIADNLGRALDAAPAKEEPKAAEPEAAAPAKEEAKAEAEAEVMKVTATHEAGWEKIMAQGTVHSLKDEWLVLLFSIPLILLRDPRPR